MQTNNKMAVVPVGKLIWQMSLPPLISMFLQYSYNLIDSAFVARLSENALTAVSLSFPIITLMNAASIWIGVGVNVLIAGYLGQRKQDEANTTVTHGLLLAFGIGALLNLLALLIMKPYFRAFTSNEEIYQLSIAYMSVCSFMQIPNMVHIAIQKMIQATGNMVAPMWFQIAGVVVNFVLNPILIFGCRRGGQFCTQSNSDFWRWHFPFYGNPWLCGGYGRGLFIVHDSGICLAAGQKTESADKNQRISFAKVADRSYFCPWTAIFYYERPQFVYGDVRQSVSGGVF